MPGICVPADGMMGNHATVNMMPENCVKGNGTSGVIGRRRDMKKESFFDVFFDYLPWLLLLFAQDCFFCLMLWLANARSFLALAAVLFLASAALFTAVLGLLYRKEKERRTLFLEFLDAPDERCEEELAARLGRSEGEMVRQLGRTLRKKEEECMAAAARVSDYEEYVESWAHEAKTPLSLLTLLLENRRAECSQEVAARLGYIRNRLQESVGQMLFYARLKGARRDYLFEYVSLAECVEDVLDDYRPLLEEKQFQVSVDVPELYVCTDRRSLVFLLSQIVSNAAKYSASSGTPLLRIRCSTTEQEQILYIRDNGPGVRESDLPYIFEKNFTGDTGTEHSHATGMGLYLAQGLAHELGITLEPHTKWGGGFEMLVRFPVV